MPIITPKRILIMEDDPVTARAHRKCLSNAGYEVQIAHDGEHGLQLLKNCRPDALLLDINLPARNGIDILKELRASNDSRNLPVFVFTAMLTDETLAECSAAGATAVFEKFHLTSSLLLEAIASALSHPA